MKQVITIDINGGISGLQRKPGQGLDLRQFGKANITRASLIEWDAERQMWFIDVLQEAGKGIVTLYRFIEACALAKVPNWRTAIDTPGKQVWADDALLFAEYDDAVKIEIAYLDALRLSGHY